MSLIRMFYRPGAPWHHPMKEADKRLRNTSASLHWCFRVRVAAISRHFFAFVGFQELQTIDIYFPELAVRTPES